MVGEGGEPTGSVSLQRSQRRAQWAQVWIQAGALLTAVIVALIWWWNYSAQRDDALSATTLHFIEPLTRSDYVHAVWRLQEFSVCFENVECGEACRPGSAEMGKEELLKRHLSYLSRKEALEPYRREAFERLARKWWVVVEDDAEHVCKKTVSGADFSDGRTLQDQFMVVYQRIAQLDICRKKGLCDFEIIRQMRDSLDFVTLQASANYFRFAPVAAREWYQVKVGSLENSEDDPLGEWAPAYFLELVDEMYEVEKVSIERRRAAIWKAYGPR